VLLYIIPGSARCSTKTSSISHGFPLGFRLDDWPRATDLTGDVFWRVNESGKAWGEGLPEKAVWHFVGEHARKAGIERLPPHDLRRYAECRIMPNRLV